MNALCYKTVFSKRLGALVAVGEHAASQGKGQGAGDASGAASGAWTLGSVLRYVGVLALGFASVSLAWSQTLPQGGRVSQGQVTISQSGQQMAITQSTAKAVVNWDSFDIGANAKVNIAQPSSQSVLLNRVLSDNPTQILGQLQANGQVVLVNPKGIVVGSDGSVSASAFTASTLNISDADFMAGNGRYSREGSTGEVVNKGRISVAPGGYVALLGARVSNEGQIIAPQGSVALGAAETVSVPIGRTGKIKLELSPSSINASVANQKGGVIVAEGGQVYMQAAALGQAVASVLHSGHIDTSGAQAGAVHVLADGGQIKVDGSITANSSGSDTQSQALMGGDIYIGRDLETGMLAKSTDVSGAKLESLRGFVETSGDVLSTTGTRVKAREWLLDPYNITIAASGATGTAYASSYTSGADSTILASDISANLTAGTSVTIATGAGGASAGFIAVNESIAKTGGGDATLTLKAHSNISVATNKTITSNTGKLNVVFNSDLDATNGGGIVFNSGSGITSNGGNITLGGGIAGNGSGFATADGSSTLQGISINTATINAGGGNIVMNGQSPTTSATNVAGILMSGGNITTTGAGQITLTGKNQLSGTTGATGTGFSMSSGTITGGSTGAVTIEGNSSTSSVTSINNKGAIINGTVTSTGGNISITGVGGSGAQFDNGVDIGGSVLGVGSANVTITGTAAAGSSGGNVGVTTSGTATVSSVNGNINITGTGGTGNGTLIRNHGIAIIGSKAISSSGTGNITIKGTATNVDNGFSLGVNINSGGVTTNTGSIKIDGAGAANYQIGVYLNAAIRSTAGGDIYVRSSGANISNTSAGTISGNNVSIDNSNGSIDSLGVITPGGAGARTDPEGRQRDGVTINGAITATNNLRMNGRNTHTAATDGAGIATGAVSITAKNMYLVGNSGFGNGIKVVGSTLSSHYYNVHGTSTSGVNGVAIQSSLIKTTGTNGFSTESIIKGTSTAIPANGYGAFMGYSTNTVEAVTGTKMTLLGEGTTTSAGANTKERGFFLQNGYTLNVSGDITLEGTSKSGEGLNIGGVLNITGTNSKLTINGTTAASSNGSLSGVNLSGTINNNGTSTQPINIVGEAKTLAGSNPDRGVSFSGAINSGTANVEILGKAASASQTGVNNTGGSITSTGTATSINITSTGNLVNSAALKVTGTTGTGANINLTASSGNISGSGAIGDTTNKNANVTFTQAGTSSYSGAINAANFTKAGTGALTLNSWLSSNLTNVSNAYTVSSGSLELNSDLSILNYPTFAPASVNVVNASTFSLSASGNGRWNNTAFNFTGGSGGGTMNLLGNPIGTTGTTNTFSTSGGASNTITGGFNANNANVNFNLTPATSGTALVDGSFAAIAFTQSTVSTNGLASATTVNMSGGGHLLFKDKLSSTTTFNINAGNVQVGDGSAATTAATANFDAANINIAAGSKLTFNRAEAYSNASVITGTGSLIQAGTGVVTLTGNSSAFAGATTVNAGKTLAIGTGGSLGAAGSTLNLASATSSVAFTNTSGTSTIGSTISGTGTLSKSGAGTGVLTADNNYTGNNTVSGGTLQIGNGGTTGTLGTGGTVALSNSANLSYLRSAPTTIANNISGTGNVSASITGASSTLTVSNPINLTGSTTSNVVNLAADNNISVAARIDTTNTTSSALLLNAGKSTNVGTSTGGDISFSGSGTVTVGTGGRATLMTGSVSGSTGLTALVGAGSGNFRYNSDETATNYTTALGTGLYGIYREAPVITATVNSVVKTYDGTAYSGGNGVGTFSGLLNGESAQLGTISYTGDSQGAKNARANTYALNATASSGLGYAVTLNPGTLTINKANLTVTASSVTKTYDGTTSATGTGIVGTLAGQAAGESVNNPGIQAFLDKNAGTGNKHVRASGVTIKDSANVDVTDNYSITYTDNTTSTINKAPLTVTANNDARFVGRTDNTPQYAGVTPTGFVNGETSAVLGGTLLITRTNSDMGAGVYNEVLSASGLTSNNYSFNYVKGNYTIVPADRLLIKTANNTVTYGTAPVYETTAQYLDSSNNEIISLTRTGTSNQYTFNDGLGTTVSAALKPYVLSTNTLAGTSTSLNTVVGSFDVKDLSPIVSGTKNFVGAPVFVGSLTVNAKEITPSATGVSKVYDGTTAMSSFVVGMNGNLDNDNVTIGGTSGAFTEKHAGAGRGYMVSGIALAGADASNYYLSGGSSLTGNNGAITQAPLKLTTNDVIKTYDGTTSAVGSAVATQSTQLFPTDTVSGGTFAFANKNAGSGNKVVTVSGVTINDGNNGGNYNVQYVSNTTSTINTASLILKAVTDTKTYDGTVASNKTVEVTKPSGISDVVTVAQEFASKNVLGPNASTLQIASGFTIKDTGGADMSGNYTISTPTAEGTINKKDVTLVSITAANKTYDGSNSASITAGVITTGVGTETLTISGSGTFADKHAAVSKEVTAYAEALTKTNGSGDWANYNLTTSGQVTTKANIAKRDLSLSAVTDTKTYDGTTISSGTVGISGTQAGDTITAIQVFDSKHTLGSGASILKVGSVTIADGNDGKNYSVTTQNTATGTIEKASLTVTATQAEKTYDGTTLAAGTGTVGTMAGQGAGETVNAAGSQAFLDRNAGTGNKHVRASGVTIKDSANADVTQNYDINYIDNTTSTIHQKEVSLSAAKTYDGDKTLSGAQLSISTGVGTETLGFTSASINSKNVADNSVNFVDAVTLSNGSNGGLASNYKLPALSAASDSNNVTLTAKALTGAIAGVAITYGTTSAPGAVSLVGIIGADDVQASNTATLVDTSTSSSGKLKAGNYAQTVSGGLTGGDVSNYSFAGFTTPTATYVVNPLTITLSGITASDKMYDGKTDAVVSVASAQFVGKINGDDLSVTSSGSFADQNAGQNKTVNLVNTLGGADLGNYSITPQSTAQATITKAPLLVKVGDTAMFVTQDPNSAFDQGIKVEGLKNNEPEATVLGTVTRTYVGSANPATGSYANVYGVTSTLTPTNYTLSVVSNLNVVAADKLLIHVGNASANYGDLTPANAGGRADTVLAQYCLAPTSCNGVNLSNLTMTRQGSLWTAKDSTNSIIQFNTVVDTTGKTSTGGFVNAGSHRFGAEGLTTQGTVNFNGYVVSGGLLTISPKSVTLNASAVTKVYDGNTNLLSAALVPTGAMADDALQAAFTSGNFAGKDAGSQNFNLSGLALQGADQANYVLGNAQFSGTGTITPKAITVSGLQAQSKVYDGTTQASVLNSGAVFNGIVAGDQLSVTATGQFDTRHVGTNKTVSLTSSFGGADLGNYSITPQASSTASITPAPLVVTASAARKTYDGNTTAPGVGTVGTLVGAAAGDQVAFGGTQAFTDKNAGSGKTVTVVGVRLVDASNADVSGNYAITYVNSQNGTIDRANASIAAQTSSTVYNGAVQSQTGLTYSGFVAGDDVQATGLASGRNAGSYLSSLSATGADVGNYNITYNNASLNISRRPASLSALGQTVVYNGQIQSLNGTQGSGFVAGDALSFGGLPSGRNVGQYSSAMTVSGADAGNYDVTLGSATLTITPKTASVTAQPERVTYNGQTQLQSSALLEGFIAGDDIRVSGLASGRNAGVYGSNVLATGQDVGNYSITYRQGALTIDKAPLQFVGTSAADKVYDGNTQARVTAGSIAGLVGNESLSVLSLSGQFDTAEPGSDKLVTVVYGLGDGQNGGLAANYDWSPVKVTANIRREASPNQAAPAASRPVGQYSRLTYIGFGGLTGVGAATGQLHYPIRNPDAQQCTPQKLEECICERPQEGLITLEICYPQRRDQVSYSGQNLTMRH